MAESSSNLVDEAQLAFDERNCIKAIALLMQLVSEKPDYGRSQELLERAYKRLNAQIAFTVGCGYCIEKKWEQAIEKFEVAQDDDPEYNDIQIKLNEAIKQAEIARLRDQADKHWRRSRWKKVVKVLKKASELDSDSEEIKQQLDDAEVKLLYHNGERFFQKKRWISAKKPFEELQERRPGYGNASERLEEIEKQLRWENLYHQAKKYEEASHLKEALTRYYQIFDEFSGYRDVGKRIGDLEKRKSSIGQTTAKHPLNSIEIPSRKKQNAFPAIRILLGFVVTTVIILCCAQLVHCWFRYNSRLFSYPGSETILGFVLALASLIGNFLSAKFNNKTHRTKVLRSIKNISEYIGGAGITLLCFGAWMLFFPYPPEDCCLPLILRNGDFEDGFKCWDYNGELDQSIKCEGNNCYAVLGNGDDPCDGGVPVGDAWMKQTLKVPEVTSPTLSLRYFIHSYDLDLEGLDYFQVIVAGDLIYQRGNDEWNEPSCDRVPWGSGWQSVKLNLSPYRGKEVEITFQNVNGTQPYYNTWTYVDDVKIDD